MYQGGAVMNFIDEIGRNKKLKYFVPYHEQALSMQVDTMARLDGFAAGFVTSGPGATNLMTGVCSAFYDFIPCFYFTGQVGQIHLKKNRGVRQLGFQETDVVSIFKPITKYAVQLNDPKKVKFELEKGYEIAISGRPGPVLFDVPFNVQKCFVDEKKIISFKNKKNTSKIKEINKLKELHKLLNNAQRPLILVGGGVQRAGQNKKFLEFVKKNQIPFVTTWMSQHITSYDNPLYNGSIGKNGHRSANLLTYESDLILCLGQRFAVKNIFGDFGKKAKIIAVDIDRNELINGWFKPNISIEINLKNFFKTFRKIKIKKTSTDWLKYCLNIKNKIFKTFMISKRYMEREKYISVYDFFDHISKLVPDNSLIFPDAGANQVWFFQSFLQKKNQIIINHTGHSPMGHSIASAIGGFYSKKSKSRKIIAFIGDGGFMMNLQEMEYINNFKIPIKIVILDNRCLGNTKLGTFLAFNGRTHGNDKKNGYYPPNIKQLCRGFKIPYYEFSNGNKKLLLKKFRTFIQRKGSSVFRLKLSEMQNVAELHTLNFQDKKFFT